MQFLPMLMQAEMPLSARFGPQAFRLLLRQFVRLFRIPNPQAFLGSPAQDLLVQQQQPMLSPPPMPGLGASPPQLGGPPPAPPMGASMPPQGPPQG
jgi:hypothetical protein